jgi:hypothetical protein
MGDVIVTPRKRAINVSLAACCVEGTNDRASHILVDMDHLDAPFYAH